MQHRQAAQSAASTTREREFERLYLDSYGLVYGYVRSRMHTEVDTEDIVAEAYLKAARAFDSFDPNRARFSTWVVAIARNCIAAHFRKAQTCASIDDVPESTAAVEGGQAVVDDRDLAIRLLSILSERERELVLMKYRDDMRNVDIAQELDMNVSTVASALSRALSKMRKLVA